MKRIALLLTLGIGFWTLSGCSEDDVVAPPSELAPPTGLMAITGEVSIRLAWDASPYESADDFVGYNVYVDTTSIASISDTTGAAFLAARLVNSTPLTTRSTTVTQTMMGGALVRGQKYYLHVRTVRDDDRLSVASNEVDTAPRPAGDNDVGDVDQLMHDYSASTSTPSGYGWERFTGLGSPFPTAQVNAEEIDFFMVEEPNSSDNGSNFVSPAQASFTSGWPTRNSTLFRDLGAGESAWETTIAPDPASMTATVKVVEDHTYALLLHDGHWAKVRVTDLEKNIPVQGSSGTVQLNRATFDWAFQLLDDYGRFKPVKGGFGDGAR